MIWRPVLSGGTFWGAAGGIRGTITLKQSILRNGRSDQSRRSHWEFAFSTPDLTVLGETELDDN